jgi:hypothetical protein
MSHAEHHESARPIPLIPAKAGIQRWVPAFVGTRGGLGCTAT